MALSIGVSVGDKINIGGREVAVKAVSAPNLIVVSVDGGEDIVLSEDRRKEIMPQVFAQVGVGQRGNTTRIAFEAPRSISIKRMGSEWRGADGDQ